MNLYLLTLFALICSSASRAVASPLDDVLTTVLRESPQIKGQTIQTEIARGDRWRRFIFNEPQFTYSNADDTNTEIFGVSLLLPFPARISSLVQLDAVKSRTAEAELYAKKVETVRAVAQAYVDCAGQEELARLQISVSEGFETVFRSMKLLYESGHTTQAEKIGAELQARQSKLDLSTAIDKAEISCQKFKQISEKSGSNNSDGNYALPDDLGASLVSKLGSQTPEQARSIAAAESASLVRASALASALPDLTITYNRNHYLMGVGSPNGHEWTTTYGFAVTIPMFFFGKESADVQRARAQALGDQNVAELQKIAADSDVRDAIREYQRSRHRLTDLRSRDLALAEAWVESTALAYRAGKVGYAELILSRKTLNDLRAQDIQLRSSLIMAHLRCLDQCDNASSRGQ